MFSNCSAGEDSWESLEMQEDQTRLSWRKSILNIHWKDWYWSWSSNTSTTWCEELTHLKRPWCWERLKAGGEEDDREQDGWMASLAQWHEFEQALGDTEGQGCLGYFSPRCHKEAAWLSKWTTTTSHLYPLQIFSPVYCLSFESMLVPTEYLNNQNVI